MRLFMLLITGLALTAAAQLPDEVEVVLVPLMTEPAPGLFGSLWETDLWVMVAENVHAFLGPMLRRDCPPPCGPPPPPHLPPNDAVRPPVFRTYPGEPDGILLYTRRDASETVAFSLRVFDSSRRSVGDGTQIPVVRERDLLVGRPAHLLNLAARPGSRLTLRVYDVDRTAGAAVRVRVFASRLEDRLLDDRIVTMIVPENDDRFGFPHPLRPGSARLTLDAAELGAAENEILRVQIDPVTPGLRYWAFAAITDNASSNVTIAVPN